MDGVETLFLNSQQGKQEHGDEVEGRQNQVGLEPAERSSCKALEVEIRHPVQGPRNERKEGERVLEWAVLHCGNACMRWGMQSCTLKKHKQPPALDCSDSRGLRCWAH